MKRCPQCHETYTDETLKFCRVDGTLLQTDGSSIESSDTLILPAAPTSDALPTQILRSEIAEAKEITSPIEATRESQTGRLKAANDIHSTSSAEYVAGEIKRHKRGSLAVLSILLLAAIGVGYWFYSNRSASTDSGQIESIAVLPFQNATGNSDAEYLSDGIAESLINSLTQLQQLRVIARSTAFRYRGREIDPQQVGRELNVRAVLTGRVRQIGERLNVQVDLVDASTGAQLWGEEYERTVSDALAIKQAIAREVSERLRLRLSGEQQQQLARRDTTNSEAYQFYLRGRHFWNKRTAEGLRRAIVEFQQAVDRDPNYALGFVGLADCHSLLEEYAGAPASETLPIARAAVDRALQIDDTLAEAHTSSAFIYQSQWRWAEAEVEYRRAISLNPNYATAHHWFSGYLRTKRQFEDSLREIIRAQELDPLSPIIGVNVAIVYYQKNDINASIAQLQRVIELDPSFPGAHSILGLTYLQQRRYEEAIAEIQRAVELSGRASSNLSDLGYCYAVTGRRNEALQILRELEERYARRQALGMYLAVVHAGLDDRDQTFAWLERDFQQRSGFLPRFITRRYFDDLRADPRYADLMRRMGLQP
jgi:TolB-like protein/Tfp pilus assembly protein PilF